MSGLRVLVLEARGGADGLVQLPSNEYSMTAQRQGTPAQ